MAKITIGIGCVLIALGVGSYLGTGRESVTALIPAFFGLPLALLGVVALNDGRRKHAMHAAAAIGLLGFLGAARGFAKLPALLSGGDVEKPVAAYAQITMSLVCLVFLVLCVNSFIKARRSGGAAS